MLEKAQEQEESDSDEDDDGGDEGKFNCILLFLQLISKASLNYDNNLLNAT